MFFTFLAILSKPTFAVQISTQVSGFTAGGGLFDPGHKAIGSLVGITLSSSSNGSYSLHPGQMNVLYLPNPILNISSTAITTTSLIFAWDAPAFHDVQDPAVDVSSYVVKYATEPITTQTGFRDATTFSHNLNPQPAGASETLEITGLSANEVYYAAIEALNRTNDVTAGNQAYLSNIATACTMANTPSMPTFVEVTSGSVTIQFNTNADKAQTFRVEYSTTDNFQTVLKTDVVQVNAASVSRVFSNESSTIITPGWRAYFRVRTYNDFGVPTPWSDAASTVPVVNEPVFGVYEYADDDPTALTVHWNAGSGNPSDTKYFVARSSDPNFELDVSTSPAYDSSSLEHEFLGLIANTTYHFRLWAENNVQDTTSTIVHVATMTTAYRVDTATRTEVYTSSATFSWEGALNNGTFSYRVELSSYMAGNSFGQVWASSSVPQTQTNATVSGLISNTTYYARIWTLNAIGQESIPAGTVSGSPFATLPNPPADSRWTEAEDYRVRVAWTNTNPATTRYEIQTSNDFPNWYTSSHVSDPGATDLMVGSLQESLSSNTTWWFRIRALGHSGTHSNFDTSFFKVTKPRPPLSAVYSNVAPSSLTLNWAHNNNSALFTRYSVTMSSTGIVDGEGRFMDVIETKNVLGNTTGFLSLGTNTTYFFQITTIDNGNWNLEHRDLTLQTSTSTLAAVPTAAAAPFSDVQLTSVRVHWDPSGNPDRTRYEVEASSDLTQTFGFISSSATVGGVPSVLASSAVLSGLAYNTTYFFRVSAVNNNGVETEPYVIDSTATLANTPNISGFTPQTTSLTVQIDPIDNPLGTVYVVENTTAGHSSGNITETSWLDGGLSINTSYYFRAQAINHDGVPTEFSASTYAWTLAAVPPAPTVGLLSRNSLRIQFSEGTNPSHTQFAIRAELVENDGNGFAGDPKHQGMFLTKTTGNTTNVYTLDVSSTDVTNPDIWHTLEEWDPYGVVIATGLGAARNYYFAIYARNGAQVVTDASLTDAGRTGADNPVIYLGSHYLNDGHAEHWVSTNTLGFTAARAYHYHYQFTQAIADPASSDPGWNGKLGGTELSDQRTDVNSLQPLAGFHASAEGLWYLQLLGDEYGVGEGFDTDHVTSPLYYSVPFPVKVDLIKPEIPSLTAQFASDDDTPIVDGEATPDSTPYFMWSEPTNGTAGAISPILGYTYSLSTDPSVEPAMSAADATFSTGTTKSVNSPTAPGKYYFKVRALDAAGNWTNPPRSFVYVNKEDKDAPTVSAITSGYGSLSLPGYMMEISVNPKATPTIVFSEPMYRRSVERPGNISLAAVRNNYGQTVNNVIAGSVTYNTLTMTATFWPGEELPRGYRFELLVSTIVTDLARNPLVRPESKIFHTFMDPEMSNVIHSEDGKTRITFSSGSWSGFYGDVAVNENPMGAPMAAPAISSLINQANSHAKRQHGAFAQSVIIRELNLYDETATRRSGKFANDVELVMSYPDADNDGFVDGSNPPIREEVLAISWLNEETGVWVRVPSSDLNKTANTITAKLRHFSVYGVIGAPSMNLSGAYAYPVPFMPSKGHRFITFTNLSSLANIRIYTANGELVRELHESDGDGTLSWDVTNSDGDPLGSDVFIYVIKNDEQKKIGKLMVVR